MNKVSVHLTKRCLLLVYFHGDNVTLLYVLCGRESSIQWWLGSGCLLQCWLLSGPRAWQWWENVGVNDTAK